MNVFLQAAITVLVQSTGLLVLGLLAVSLARRHGPAFQTLIGRATLAGVGMLVLLAPLSGRVAAVWRIPTPTQASAPGATAPDPETGRAGVQRLEARVAGPGSTIAVPARPIPVPVHVGAPTPAAPNPPPNPSFRKDPVTEERGNKEVGLWNTVVVLYAFVCALLLCWLGICQWHLTRLRHTAQAITSGSAQTLLASLTDSPPLLLTHPAVQSPFLAGLRRPALFLPVTYDSDFDQAALRAIFVHELAHRDRCDNAWTLAARLLTAVLWPQSLLWLLCRRLEQISEDACDEAVLAADCPPRAYADCLLTLAERHALGHRQRVLSAGITPVRSSLGRRVQHILSKGTRSMSTVSPHLRLTIAALSVVAALGGTCLVSSAPAKQGVQFAFRQPVVHSSRSPLVGMWLYKAQPIGGSKDGLVIYQPNGQFEYIFAGDTWHDPHQVFGTYVTNRDSLKEFSTRASFQDPNQRDHSQILPIDVRSTTIQFRITGDKLSVRDATGEVSTAVRVTDTAQVELMQKMLEDKTKPNPDIVVYASGNIRISGLLKKELPEVQALTGSDRQLSQAQFLAGLTPVQGPGVIVTLADSKKPYSGKFPAGFTPPNSIHDSDINAVVNELKAAGAEAISVNDQRLVSTSSVRTAGPVIYVNGAAETEPYLIKAIGDTSAMTSILQEPHGIAAQIEDFDPGMFRVQEAANLVLPAYSGSGTEPRYAKPVLGQGNLPSSATGRGRHLQELQAQIDRVQEELARQDNTAHGR